MLNSKEEVKQAIMTIAKKYGLVNNYKAMFDAGTSLPRMVEAVAYEMFVNSFNYELAFENEILAYDIIFSYALELKANGFVEFKN